MRGPNVMRGRIAGYQVPKRVAFVERERMPSKGEQLVGEVPAAHLQSSLPPAPGVPALTGWLGCGKMGGQTDVR